MPTSTTTLSPDEEPGPLLALALCSLEGLPIGRGKEGVVQSGSAAHRWSNRLPWNPAQARTQRQQLRAAVSQSSQSTTGPSPQPLPRAQAQQRGAPWDRRRGWHRRGLCCFPKALGHTQQYVQAWNVIPPGRRWMALFPQRSTLGKSRMLTLKLKSRTWKPHRYAGIFSSLESRQMP